MNDQRKAQEGGSGENVQPDKEANSAHMAYRRASGATRRNAISSFNIWVQFQHDSNMMFNLFILVEVGVASKIVGSVRELLTVRPLASTWAEQQDG